MKHEQVGLEQQPLEGTAAAHGATPWRQETRGVDGKLLTIAYAGNNAYPLPDAVALKAAGFALSPQPVSWQALGLEGQPAGDLDILVLALNPRDTLEMDQLDQLLHRLPDLGVVAVVDGLSVADTRLLLRKGVLDALPQPVSVEDLRIAAEPLRKARLKTPKTIAESARKQGKTVVVLGAMGGVGSTSLATQLGIQWAGQSRVGLLDFDVQHGAVGLLLDMRPSHNISSMMEDTERLDSEIFQSVAVKHASGLEVVTSAPEMLPLDVMNSAFVDQVLRLATGLYDVVLVDLPKAWTDWSVHTLQRADCICLVINLSVPGIYHARRQLELLDANGLLHKVKLVANRVQKSFLGRVDMKDHETVLKRRIDITLSDDAAAMGRAGDEGRSLVEVSGKSRLVKDLREMAEAISVELLADKVA